MQLPLRSTTSLPLSIFSNDTATTEIYTLSLHDALPISSLMRVRTPRPEGGCHQCCTSPSRNCRLAARSSCARARSGDRKSTRLNSSHPSISYAVFCLKKKNYGFLCVYSSHHT